MNLLSRRPGARVAAALLMAGAALVGSSCADASGDRTLSSEDQYLRSLLEESSPSQTDDIFLLMLREQEEQTAACMRKAGFEYEAAPPESLYIPGDGLNYDDDDVVAEYGFGISTRDRNVQADVDNPNDSIYARLEEGARAQWSDQRQTCATSAEAAVGRKLGIDRAVDTAAAVAERVAADPEVVAAAEAWATCMGRRGHDAPDIESLIHDLNDEWQDTAPDGAGAFRAKELAAAADSHECGGRLRPAKDRAREAALRDMDGGAHDRIYGG